MLSGQLSLQTLFIVYHSVTHSWLRRIVKANDETSFLLTIYFTFSYLSSLCCCYWLYQIEFIFLQWGFDLFLCLGLFLYQVLFMCCIHIWFISVFIFLRYLYSCTASHKGHHWKGPGVWYPKKGQSSSTDSFPVALLCGSSLIPVAVFWLARLQLQPWKGWRAAS